MKSQLFGLSGEAPELQNMSEYKCYFFLFFNNVVCFINRRLNLVLALESSWYYWLALLHQPLCSCTAACLVCVTTTQHGVLDGQRPSPDVQTGTGL